MTTQFVYFGLCNATHDERQAVQARFKKLFEPDTDLYKLLCPFKAVYAVDSELLVKVHAWRGSRVEITIHKGLVSLPLG